MADISKINLNGSEYNIVAEKATKDSSGNTISSYYMKRGTYERIQGTSSERKNLNNYTSAGFYNVRTAYVDNCPSGIGVDAVLLVYAWDSSTYEFQEISETADCTTNRRWIRHKNGSTWSSWTEIISSENIGSQSVNYATSAGSATKATQDGSGNVITSTYYPKSGGNLDGTLTINGNYDIVTIGNDNYGIRPAKANYGQVGSSSYYYYRMYAAKFYGEEFTPRSGTSLKLNNVKIAYNSSTETVTFS